MGRLLGLEWELEMKKARSITEMHGRHLIFLTYGEAVGSCNSTRLTLRSGLIAIVPPVWRHIKANLSQSLQNEVYAIAACVCPSTCSALHEATCHMFQPLCEQICQTLPCSQSCYWSTRSCSARSRTLYAEYRCLSRHRLFLDAPLICFMR